MKYTDGSSFEGQFKNGRKEGVGFFIDKYSSRERSQIYNNNRVISRVVPIKDKCSIF
jgi:hypothetical protein